MMDRCTRLWEIDPYRDGRLGEKDARSFERHLRACSACSGQLERDERLRELARALPDADPGELPLRRLRARVMRDAATGDVRPGRPRGWRLAATAAVVLVGLGGWAAVASRHVPTVTSVTSVTVATASGAGAPSPTESPGAVLVTETLAGTVVASAGSRWSQKRGGGVEEIAFEDGSLHMHVRPLAAGERLVVVLPDGELEVRGTTFDVDVTQGATTRVHVDEGVVELRLRGQTLRRLQATETWVATAPTASRQLPPLAPPAHTAASEPVAAADGIGGYSAAMELLRGGRNDEAAAAFHAFALSQPRAPQAEDASFLEAVALARAGRIDAAGLAAEHHLASYPGSFHRKEAAILVARAAAQRGR
jgi:TolA-binding protein